MMNRSPGARNGAELVKSKGERVSAVLSSAVLPKEKTAAVLPTGIVSMANPAPPAIDVILPGSVAPLPFGPIVPPTSFNFPPPGGGGGGGSFPPPGGGFTPPGGGGGFTPPGLNPPPVPPPVPPVPEPSTWATMLLGFALTGWAVRRRPRRAAKRAVAALA
jgi:hypothetical protein